MDFRGWNKLTLYVAYKIIDLKMLQDRILYEFSSRINEELSPITIGRGVISCIFYTSIMDILGNLPWFLRASKFMRHNIIAIIAKDTTLPQMSFQRN